MKHFNYKQAEYKRSKNQIIVPDINSSFKHNLADLLRLTFKKEPHKYILLSSECDVSTIITLAQHYQANIIDTLKEYEKHKEDYMRGFYTEFDKYPVASIYCKQFGINKVYDKLRKMNINDILED